MFWLNIPKQQRSMKTTQFGAKLAAIDTYAFVWQEKYTDTLAKYAGRRILQTMLDRLRAALRAQPHSQATDLGDAFAPLVVRSRRGYWRVEFTP